MTKNLKELLPTILRAQDNWRFALLERWPTIVGTLSSKVRIEKIHQDVLILGVEDPCWLQELYLLSPVLLSAINKTLGQPRIKQLRFKTTGLPNEKKGITPQYKPIRKKINVSLTTREKIALENVKDPELSQALQRFLVRCYQEKV